MSRESGTRSGLLWQVGRLLLEITREAGQLPQILLMENVPDVLSEKNRKDFFSWCEFLESLGYTSKYSILNSKDFGVPQNRERCFMLSWLEEDSYCDFPNKQPLVVRLKDFLEHSVDKKYYLSEKTIKYFIQHTQESIQKGNGFRFELTDGNSPKHNNRVIEPIVWDGFNQSIRKDSSCVGTLTGNCGKNLKRNGQGIIENSGVRLFQYGHGYLPFGEINSDVFPTVRESNTARYNNAIQQNGDFRVRKLTPKECWRLMGFDDESFSRAAGKVSNSQLYKQAGNSIVVPVLEAIFKQLL